MQLNFGGKTAVVTGGSNGIGRAMANALAAAGAAVWIFDRESADAHHFVQTDVTDRAQLESAFAQSGVPDVVMVNAGAVVQAPLTETTREQWMRILNVNLTGAFDTVQLASRAMKANGRGGSIVLTASTNSFDGEENLTAYNATKAGLLGILRTAANEFGPYGIRINAVCPGLIHTRLTQPLFDAPGAAKEYFRHIAIGRAGQPSEVAAAALFLASDLASYLTGATLLVDGGQMASKYGPWRDDSADFKNDRWQLR